MANGGNRLVGRAALVTVLATLAVVVAACTPPAPRGAFTVGGRCRPALLVTARGSGDQPGSDEVRAMVAALRDRLGRGAVQAVELGDLDGDGVLDPGGYPAAGILAIPGLDPAADPAQGQSTILGGFNESMRVGGDELLAVLGARAAACPHQRIVLSGYSLGAATIGAALGRLPATVAERVDAVAFFGDPTYREGPWSRAPGAQVLGGVGLLGGRSPYVPDAFAGRTTSWCGLADTVCTGNVVLSLLELVPCQDFPSELACHRRHSDYGQWAIGPAMSAAGDAVRAHLP